MIEPPLMDRWMSDERAWPLWSVNFEAKRETHHLFRAKGLVRRLPREVRNWFAGRCSALVVVVVQGAPAQGTGLVSREKSGHTHRRLVCFAEEEEGVRAMRATGQAHLE